MAKTDPLKQLAKQPPAVKAGILVGVLVVLGALYWQFFYSELHAAKKKEAAKKTSLLKKADSLDKKIADMKKLVERRRELNAELDRIQLALPSESELTSFVQHLQSKAGEARVSFNWSSKKEAAVGEYIRVPLSVTAVGTFHQLTHYFYLLGPYASGQEGSQADTPTESGRIVTIDDLNISNVKTKNGEVVLTAKFIASTFRKEGKKGAGK